MGYYSPFWCPCAISLLVELQGPITCLRAGHRHSPFWLIRPVSCAIAHLFEVLERFPRLMNLGVHLPIVHQHSPFWPILARFMGYYSLIWGFGAILWLLNPNVRLCVGH